MRGVLYLASTSPRRRELLLRAGIDFELHPPGPEVEGTGAPAERAVQRARSKATGAPISARGVEGVLLGVDTVVVARSGAPSEEGGVELGKPRDREHAAWMLGALSGRVHEVVTAHCLVVLSAGQSAGSAAAPVTFEEVAVSRVRCASLTPAAIEAYLDRGDWDDKAGGYGIQGAAGEFMELVEGELDTVIGLNLRAVRRLLEEAR